MKNLLLIFTSIICLTGYTQETEQPPIIFEGVVLSATEFFIDSTGKANTNTSGEYGLKSVYTTNTSYLVKVTRVLKGQAYLDTGYVEVITKLSYGHLRNQGKYENYIPKLYPGIFFTEINTVPVTLERKTNNNVVLQPFNFKPMKIDLNRYGCYAVIPKGKSFKTKKDLAKHLKYNYNIDYLGNSKKNAATNSTKNNQPSTKKKSVLSNGGSVKTSEDYQQNLENYKQFIEVSNLKKNIKTPQQLGL